MNTRRKVAKRKIRKSLNNNEVGAKSVLRFLGRKTNGTAGVLKKSLLVFLFRGKRRAKGFHAEQPGMKES